MYVNKCIKCGVEFETKNPKRVICPNCLYADKNNDEGGEKKLTSYSSYSTEDRSNDRPQRPYNNRGYDRNNGGGYQQRGGYNNNRRFDNNYGDNRGGYQQRRPNNNGGGYQQRGGYNDNRGGYQQQGNRFGGQQRRPNNRFQQGGQRRPGGKPQPRKQAKPLLISKEQLEQIEVLYKTMLPLPNPDAHEVIGTHIGIEPRKVFFGINLVRQKLMLPKLPYPKRKLAVTVDQMTAIKSLYTPLLPLPPIGCHKIIAAQLKVDEWRVHVAIKLIRAQMGLDRWNEDRPDKPADYMVPKYPAQEKAQSEQEQKTEAVAEEVVEESPKKSSRKTKAEEPVAEEAVEEAPKKRGRKAKTEEPVVEEATEEAPKKRGRKPKKTEDE